MTTEQINEFAGFVLTLAAIPATATAVIYGFGSPWWQSWLGRVMFAKWTTVAAILLFVVARRTWGDFPGYEWWALVIYSLTLITFSATTVEVLIERRGPDDGSIPPQQEDKYMTNENLTSDLPVPDIWYKAQRVLRTLVQVGIPTYLTFALVLPQIIDAIGLPVDSQLYVWLIGLATGVTAVAMALTRIMAIPAVNAWLTKIGLGSVPKSAIVSVPTGKGTSVATVVPDPKAETPEAGSY